MNARVIEIYVASEAGAPMQWVDSIRALARTGLEGDRYARRAGTYSKFPGAHDVTLFEIEAVWGFYQFSDMDLHPSQVRRNLITEGVRLADLINVEFTIGAVRFRGLRPCPPCLYLAQLLKVPELLRGLAHSGGLYAEVLNEGVLGVGDVIARVQDEESHNLFRM